MNFNGQNKVCKIFFVSVGKAVGGGIGFWGGNGVRGSMFFRG